jgi:GNAT superfamily N-acetyltransferase
MLLNFIKRLSRFFLRDYSIYRIYGHECAGKTNSADIGFVLEPVEEIAIVESEDEMIAQQAWYCGEYSQAYACKTGSRIVGLCFFWYGKRYSTRNFWPLKEDEAKLVQLVVLPSMRGQGIARQLIEFGTEDMSRLGFRYAYARIWWSNGPSLRAFQRAGWRHVATIIDILLPYRMKPFRLKLAKKDTSFRR